MHTGKVEKTVLRCMYMSGNELTPKASQHMSGNELTPKASQHMSGNELTASQHVCDCFLQF